MGASFSSGNPFGTSIGTSEIQNGAVTDAKLNSMNIAQTNIQTIQLSANASVTPLTHDNLISDTFSDATGYLNSVATATSTAIFDVSKYKRMTYTAESHGLTMSADNSTTYKVGVVIQPDVNCSIHSIVKQSGSNETKVYLYLSSVAPGGSPIGSAAFVGDLATFSSPLAVTTGNTYYLVADGEGANVNHKWSNAPSFPYDTGNLKMTNGVYDGSGSWDTPWANVMFLKSINIAITGNPKIDISLGTITGSVTHTQLIVDDVDRETGDNITYKLKNATQNDADLAIDTYNAVVNLTTAPTGIEINLVPKSSSPTDGYPSIKSYCLKLWKA